MKYFWRDSWLVSWVLLLSAILQIQAIASIDAQPRVVVVLADHLTLSDMQGVFGDTDSLSVGLMSPGRPLGSDPVASLCASLGAGDSIQADDISEGLLCRALHSAGKRIAVIGDADGDDTGKYRPILHFIPKPDTSYFGANSGSIADPLAPGGCRVNPVAMANLATGALAANDLIIVHFGDFERSEREDRAGYLTQHAYAAYRRADIANLAGFRRLLSNDLSKLGEPPTRLYFIVAAPVRTWDHLNPVVVQDFHMAGQDGVLMSATTRTRGLIAARDIAPSILSTLGVPIPIQMTGAVIRSDRTANADSFVSLARLDRITTLDQQVQTPFFWVFGFLGGFVAVGIILMLVLGNNSTQATQEPTPARTSPPLPKGKGKETEEIPATARTSSGYKLPGSLTPNTGGTGSEKRQFTRSAVLYAIRVFSSWPLAMLIAPVLDPHSVAVYLGYIAGLCFLIGLLPSPAVILFTTSVAVVLDGFFGSPLVARTILSGYALAGIRFYGIGNEYMGVLIGGALMLPVLFPSSPTLLPRGEGSMNVDSTPEQVDGKIPRRDWFLAAWFCLVIFVLSFPAFGAKAGGAITAASTFLFAWWALRGQRIGPGRIVYAIALGFALVFAWALLAKCLGLALTHIDTAVRALTSGRIGYIRGVSVRKVGMAIRVMLHPGTLCGLAGLLVLALGLKALLGERIAAFCRGDRVYAAVAGAGLRGCIVALLFNDSGVVAAILMCTSLITPLLFGLVNAEREQSSAIRLAS